jgi:crotonobetainyl-CoA:carnitine CoA-transferase CaiB-like acyl-CoA transferase
VLSGLYHRYLTDAGIFIEVPQLEMTASLLHKPLMEYLFTEELPNRIGARDGDERFVQGVYPTEGDDRWVVIAIESNEEWERLCRVIGRPSLIEAYGSQYSRLANHDTLDEIISEWTRERSQEEVRELLRSRDIPVGIVANEEDLVEYDPQLRVRDYFTEHDIPEVGEATFQGLPFKLQKATIGFPSRAPQFGEHSAEVLEEWLGYSSGEIADKEEQGALY